MHEYISSVANGNDNAKSGKFMNLIKLNVLKLLFFDVLLKRLL